ncbi:MAG: SusC/RagA family TonB-linked outer membrane protein, partial [Bacteroidota bacterium]
EDGNRDYYLSTDVDKATASKEIMGSRIPDIYGSFSNDFMYKGFDLSVMTTYSLGGQILDGVYRNLMYGWYVGQASHVNRGRAWKNPGDITDVPRVEIGNTYPVTDNDLIDASYFAIKNVTLGYTLPAQFSQNLKLESIRFTATGDNLMLFTHLKGMDPQYNFSGGTSYVYTPVRTISFGVDVKF